MKKIKRKLMQTLLYTICWRNVDKLCDFRVYSKYNLLGGAMKIVKKQNFLITIVGKCLTETDILQLFNFGFSKEQIVKKYKKDNKLKIEEARRFVEKILLQNILQERR